MTPAQRKPSYDDLERLTRDARTERSLVIWALMKAAAHGLWSRLAEPLRNAVKMHQPSFRDRPSPHPFG